MTVADAQHQATDDARVDLLDERHTAPQGFLEATTSVASASACRSTALVTSTSTTACLHDRLRLELCLHVGDQGHAALVEQHVQGVGHELVARPAELAEHAPLGGRFDLRVEQHVAQRPRRGQRREGAHVAAHAFDAAASRAAS